ncbi:MAG: outer membrane assembly protein BamE [Hyphomicrobiales bacterium]|nr:MAG: outer membrane assembly protein BamE [Hyphomicrobiales bacterium]
MELPVHSQKFGTGIARPARITLAAAGMALLLAGCNAAENLTPSETLSHGFVIDQATLDLVPVGSSREQVLLSLGTPSTTATFDSEAFYYISQTRKRPVAFMNPRVTDQRVLAVYFGADGRVSNIAHYGMQDGKVFDFISRTTPTGGKETSFLGGLITGMLSGGAPTANPNPF